MANNTRVVDFRCVDCGEPYQLKSRKSPIRSVVADGAYRTFQTAVEQGNAPNLLLLHYSHPDLTVKDFFGIHRKLLSPLSIVKRKPLSETARRAGWVGCNIDLHSIPPGARIPIVIDHVAVPARIVQVQWQRYSSLIEEERVGEQGWLRDILACIQKTDTKDFHLDDIYAFENDLGQLHPVNRNIRPKIRQQLQILVRQGIIERVEAGVYRKKPA
jgi:type II restriction enzyme